MAKKKTIPSTSPDTLFDIAKKLVYGDRQKQYGPFEPLYELALAMYWEWKRNGEIESVSDFMMLMAFMKLARNQYGQPKEDNIVDAMAYLELHHRAKQNGR
jgi:hypothetical protein